jgi:hypothetical protein
MKTKQQIFEDKVRKIVKEELPQFNKGSQQPAEPAKVKSKKMENVRFVAQTFKTLLTRLDELETDSESSAYQEVANVKKHLLAAQQLFLKKYVTLYK